MPDNAVRQGGKQSRQSSKSVRAFSPAVAEALAKAASAYAAESTQADDTLRAAILAAAAETRGQKWRPEEFIGALLAAAPQSETVQEGREPLHALLKRRGLVAFFGQHESGT
jgi:hypothetical protein